MSELSKYVRVSDAVREALEGGRPVVALESTIISHGMPYPKNVKTALRVEEMVRRNGALPATTALLDGQIVVGLTEEEIERVGQAGLSSTKTSRRDIPIVLAEKKIGSTTVTGTMLAAHLAGISVLATGGIGGVHRRGETTMDISADLEELSQTSVMVVCSGAKSVLDIGRTLEYLETKGVPVIGFQTDRMPAFYTRDSGFSLAARLDEPADIARAFEIKRSLGLSGGMMVANPIPVENEMDAEAIENTIQEALREVEDQGIVGKDITPFLLDRIHSITGGKSLESNIALVLNNARVAALIAVELSKESE